MHHTLDAVIHTPSELNQRFHLEGKHRALLLPPITGARKRSQQPQFYTITLSGRKSAPCSPLLQAERCQPGLEQKPLKLSYSRNDLSSLWERILYNLVKASSASVFFFLYYACCDQTDTLIPRTHAGLRLVAPMVEGKPVGSICVQFAAYACVCVCVCGLCAGHSALCELTRIAIIHHSTAPASGCVKKPAFLSAISHSYLP